MSHARVLIVEDELEIAELIRFHVDREGFDSRIVQSGRMALSAVETYRPDVLLLDLMLPDLDGLEVCRRLKRQTATQEIPILIVSAKGEEVDVVTGIELGADDYVTKPFGPKVLMARMRNILRRRERDASALLSPPGMVSLADGALTIDSDRHIVKINEMPVELTLTEYGILEYLAAKPGFVRTRDQIISAVHGKDVVLSGRTVDVHVTALRKKLGELGPMIQTVRGVGYRLSEPATVPDEE